MTRNLRYGIAGAVLTAAVLGGAVAVIPGLAQAEGTRTASSASPAPPVVEKPAEQSAEAARAAPDGPRSAAVAKRTWRNSTQFQEVKSGRVTPDGGAILLVRPAKKEILGESFRTVPVSGPYTEVVLSVHARILMLDGESGTPEVFVQNLKRREAHRPNHVTPDERQEGFNLIYDANGRISQVEWLYAL